MWVKLIGGKGPERLAENGKHTDEERREKMLVERVQQLLEAKISDVNAQHAKQYEECLAALKTLSAGFETLVENNEKFTLSIRALEKAIDQIKARRLEAQPQKQVSNDNGDASAMKSTRRQEINVRPVLPPARLTLPTVGRRRQL